MAFEKRVERPTSVERSATLGEYLEGLTSFEEGRLRLRQEVLDASGKATILSTDPRYKYLRIDYLYQDIPLTVNGIVATFRDGVDGRTYYYGDLRKRVTWKTGDIILPYRGTVKKESVETLARSSKYADQAQKALRQDYDAFRKTGEVAVQNRHDIEARYFESRSPEIARAVEKGEIGRPIALMLMRYFPHLIEKQIREIVAAYFSEKLFVQDYTIITGLKSDEVRKIVTQCKEMLEAYKVLEYQGIRDASPNWPKRQNGLPRNMLVNRSKLVVLSYDIYKEAHPDVAPELRKDLPVVRYEHRDIHGKIIAIVHAQYREVGVWEATKNFFKYPHVLQAIQRYGIGAITKQMCSLVIEIPKTKKKIDILKMTGQENAQIFIIDTPQAIDGIKMASSNMIFVHEPKTSHELFALLHELGHNDQELDMGFRNVAGDSSWATGLDIKSVFSTDVEGRFKKMGEVCAQSKNFFRDQIITKADVDDMLLSLKEVNALLIKYNHKPVNWNAVTMQEGKEGDDFLKRHAPEESKNIDARQQIFDTKFKNFLAWRTRFAERDASRRALRWFRRLRTEGADYSRRTPFSIQDAVIMALPYESLKSVIFDGGIIPQDISRTGLASQNAGNQGMRDFYKQMGVNIKKPKKKR